MYVHVYMQIFRYASGRCNRTSVNKNNWKLANSRQTTHHRHPINSQENLASEPREHALTSLTEPSKRENVLQIMFDQIFIKPMLSSEWLIVFSSRHSVKLSPIKDSKEEAIFARAGVAIIFRKVVHLWKLSTEPLSSSNTTASCEENRTLTKIASSVFVAVSGVTSALTTVHAFTVGRLWSDWRCVLSMALSWAWR